MDTVERLRQQLDCAGVRAHVDDREGQTPGFKFNDWEMRGVPLRMEIGPKDVENNNAVLARRDVLGRQGKQFVSQDGVLQAVETLLADIQQSLLDDARAFRDEHIMHVSSYDELRTVIEEGDWARAYWDGTDEDELAVKDDTGATIRCFPFEQETAPGACIYSRRQTERVALFAKAY